MHELALCESVLDIVCRHAATHGVTRITVVRLELGALSCVDPDAIEFCFAAVADGTIAEGARIDIERVAGEAWCLDCGAMVTLIERYDPCPRCGGHHLRIAQGDEMRVKELEAA